MKEESDRVTARCLHTGSSRQMPQGAAVKLLVVAVQRSERRSRYIAAGQRQPVAVSLADCPWREADRHVASQLWVAVGNTCGALPQSTRWVHLDGYFTIGCRAATFDGRGWNETVTRNWTATPTA